MFVFYLDDILKELNISRTKFAHMCNVRPNTINDMCNGHTKRIELETLDKIIKTLNQIGYKQIDIEDIIKYVEDD